VPERALQGGVDMDGQARRSRVLVRDPDRLIAALLEISNLVGSVMRLDDILFRIARITADLLEVPVCSIYLLQPDGKLQLRSNVGLEPELTGRVALEPGQGIAGWVAAHGEMVSIPDATQDPRNFPLPSALENQCRACLCAPLRIQEEIIGVMSARKMEPYEFTVEQKKVFETVCKQVAIVIEKARMYEEKIKAEQLAAVAVSLSGLAHYIKNVLFTSQIGEYLVDRGLNEWNDLDRVREGWKTLHQANQKIRKLVENMLNYCRQTKLELKPVVLNDMLKQIVDAVDDQAAVRRIEMRAELDPGLGTIMLEPESIYDAFLNLVTNAVDAIPEGRPGRVVIRSYRIPDQTNVVVEVCDNGTGIPPEHRDKIFNLFFSTKGKKGTGIGLAATRKIIEDHKGSVSFETKPGEGTCFRVYLPLQTAQ